MTRARTKVLLKVLNYHQRSLSKLDIENARRYFEKISRTPKKPRMHRLREQHISHGEHKIKIRIYGDAPSRPTIVYFHGGGFMLGSIDSHDSIARHLCKATGLSVISVNYRLAPEYPSPAATKDGLAVIGWLQQQQDLHNEFILAGDSAGGHIALTVALQLDKKLKKKLRSLLLMYPALDPRLTSDSMQKFANGYFVSKDNMQRFWSTYLDNNHISWPLSNEVLLSLPPTLIQTADYDILRDEGKDFFAQLHAAGKHAEYFHYKDTVHGLLQMPNIASKRNKALRDIANFVAKY